MKQLYKHLLFAASGALLLAACKKEFSAPYPKDNTPLVRSTFEGVVKDVNNHVLDSAEVTSGGVTILTDSTGYFKLTQVLVDSTNAAVIATKTGYSVDTVVMTTHAYASHQVAFTLQPAN